MEKILQVPDVRQATEATCGVSVTQAITAYYGEDYGENELSKMLQPFTMEDGVPRANMIKFFKEHGYKVWQGKMEIEHIIKCIDKEIPVILLIQAWSGEETTEWSKTVDWGHYVIAIGYNDEGIIFEDPAIFARGFLTYDEFELRWHGLDDEYLQNYGMIVFGKPESPIGQIYHIDEGGKTAIKDDKGESHINESKNKRLPVIKRFYQKLGEMVTRKLLRATDDEEEPEVLEEAMTGPKFYELVSSAGFEKDELFRIKLPIEILDTKKFKNAYSITIETEIPIDVEKMKDYINKFNEAITKNTELYVKYKKMAYWYTNFNKLMIEQIGESDAMLFLVAAAYCSANTALDANIIEAAKLFTAVKIDFNRGNNGKGLLRYLATNINDIDNPKNIEKLAKIGDANSAYLRLLSPKIDPSTGERIKEITVSGAKLKNFNDFIIYYLDHEGKITKEELVNDIKSGRLPVGGTKIYSFLLNLVDPDFEWVNMGVSEYKGGKIQPATIDRWMIRVFFDKTLNNAIKELVDNNIIESSKDAVDKFKNTVIMQLFGSDITRANIIKLMNELLVEFRKKNPETELHFAHQLQAFGWVLIRDEYDEPSAEFASFEDVMNFTEKISNKIDTINPQLNFIKNAGQGLKQKVMTAINLLGNIPRMRLRNDAATDKTIKKWLSFHSTFDQPEKKKKEASEGGVKYLITKPIEMKGVYQSEIKKGRQVLKKITADSPSAVFLAAKKWIRNKQKATEIEEEPKVKMVKNPKSVLKKKTVKEEMNEIISDMDKYLVEYFDIKEKGFKLRNPHAGYLIGPDGRIFHLEDEHHGHVLGAYPELQKQCIMDLGYEDYVELWDASDIGTDELYYWLYSHGFVRGFGAELAFITLNNKQKDAVIDLIENNKNFFKKISVEKYSDEVGKSTRYNTYNMRDFFRKFLM